MKNRLFLIFTVLFAVLTFTTSSLTQDSPQEDLLESLQEGLRDAEKTDKVNKLVYSTDDINFSHDGKRLALAGNYGILIYDIQRNRKNVQASYKPTKLREHQGRGWRVAFSPDGKLIASANATGTLYLWDAKTEKLLRTIEDGPEYSSFGCMAFSPDGRIIATGGSRIITKDGPARKGTVNNVSITMDGWITDGIVRLWDTQTGEHIRTLTGQAERVNSVAFSPDGTTIAAGDSLTLTADSQGRNPTVHLWDARTGKLLRTLKGHRHRIQSVAFSPDGKLIASGGDSAPIRLWDVNTGQQIRTLQKDSTRNSKYLDQDRPPLDGVDSIAFSPDGSTLVSCSIQSVLLWDVKRGRVLRKFREQNGGSGPSIMSFSPDGRTVAVCRSYELNQIVPKRNGVMIRKEIELMDAETGKHLHRIKLERYRFETYR